MKFVQTPLPTVQSIHLLMNEAREAEHRRDITAMRKILHTIWDEDAGLPEFQEYEPLIRAELFRFCGFYVSFYTRCYSLKNKQINAKDLLTRAIDIFENINLFERAAEAKVILAYSYWNAGELPEAEDLLKVIEFEFANNHNHPVYLHMMILRLMISAWLEDFEKAFRYIEKIEEIILYCTDIPKQNWFAKSLEARTNKVKYLASKVFANDFWLGISG